MLLEEAKDLKCIKQQAEVATGNNNGRQTNVIVNGGTVVINPLTTL